ncbi:hypothetical protein YC2023_055817 [Brassica napus]
MTKNIIQVAKKANRFIAGGKIVTRAFNNNDPLVLLIVANDETCEGHVAKATELTIIILSSREEVGELVGFSYVVCCAVTFVGIEEMMPEFVLVVEDQSYHL